MTQKELLYVEDAIGHEQNVGQIVSETINMLEDKNLQAFLKSELKKHQRIIEQENHRLETEYKNTQRHLQQLHYLLEQINEQKEQFTQSEDVIAPPIVKEPVKVHTKTKRKKKPINS